MIQAQQYHFEQTYYILIIFSYIAVIYHMIFIFNVKFCTISGASLEISSRIIPNMMCIIPRMYDDHHHIDIGLV